MKTKTLLEQRDRFNQRLTLEMELDNGEPVRLDSYVKKLVSTQSLEAWNGNSDKFKAWIAEQVSNYVIRSNLKIWGHSN